MKIQVIGHAGLLIEVSGVRILTDPWWEGPAYHGQWYPYPIPAADRSLFEKIDYLYISHGHHDHLHESTLKLVPKTAVVLIPYLLEPGLGEYLKFLGFDRVVECPYGERIALPRKASATIYNNEDDSFLVLEGEGEILLNGNDALHADTAAVIEHFCRLIKRHHPRIDYMFMGYGGAAWFPNCVDFTDAAGFYDPAYREFLFTRNFIRIADLLRPSYAFPFAASFALLEKDNRWVNRMKFSVPDPSFCLEIPGVQSYYLMPGDSVERSQVRRGKERRPSPDEAEREIGIIYRQAIDGLEAPPPPPPEWIDSFARALGEHAGRKSAYLIPAGKQIDLRIDVAELPQRSFLLSAQRGRAQVTPVDPDFAASIILKSRREILEACLTEPFGYEAITIGCGARIYLRKGDFGLVGKIIGLISQKANPETLLGNYRLALRRQTRRTLRYLYHSRHWLPYVLKERLGLVKSNDVYSLDPARWNPERYEDVLREYRAAIEKWRARETGNTVEARSYGLAV
ncbi:MAG: MBL fold metallo-hydrolase [Candidatus Binatia bacterium]